jgi:hypothetical protein
MTYESILVSITQEPVHVLIIHHMVREVQNSEIESVISGFVEYDLTCRCQRSLSFMRGIKSLPASAGQWASVQSLPRIRKMALSATKSAQDLIGRSLLNKTYGDPCSSLPRKHFRSACIRGLRTALPGPQEVYYPACQRTSQHMTSMTYTVHVHEFSKLGM